MNSFSVLKKRQIAKALYLCSVVIRSNKKSRKIDQLYPLEVKKIEEMR